MENHSYRGPATEPRQAKLAFILMLVTVPIIYAANSTLIFDDPGLYEHFGKLLGQDGPTRTLITLLFNRDLHEGYSEYRTYGLSKVFHFLIWTIIGPTTWVYSALIGLTQAVSGAFLYLTARRLGCDAVQALLVAIVWIACPFAVTTCFHHYSYLILPVQATIAAAFLLQWWLSAKVRGRLLGYIAIAVLSASISLMGEAHIPLTAVVVLGIAAASGAGLRRKAAVAATFLVSTLAALALHHRGWRGPHALEGANRFNVASLGPEALIYRSREFWSSVLPGAGDQIGQILSFSGASAMGAAVFFAVSVLAIGRLSLALQASGPTSGDAGNATPRCQARFAWLVAACAVVAASTFVVPWALALVVGPYGSSLPRRYGYVPYTILTMAAVAILSAPYLRARMSLAPALTAVSSAVALYATLVLVCLPTVRAQDGKVWAQLDDRVRADKASSILFANAWLPSSAPDYVSGHDTPGLRGPNFPIVFESPLMSLWWQSLYAKARYGLTATGDGYGRTTPQNVSLTGMVRGVHFLNAGAIETPKSSLLVAFDPRLVPPHWRDGPAPLKLLGFDEFPGAHGTYARTDTGWAARRFGSSLGTVTIDVGGVVNDVATAGTLPDKRWANPATLHGPVSNYGLESGEDRVYRPNPMPRSYRDYYETNRHGDFTYRLDFSDASPKLVAIDFLDFWSRRSNTRVISVDVMLDEQLVVLGQIDTSTPSGNQPVTVQFLTRDAKSLRIHLRKAFPESDIPLISGIRVTASSGEPVTAIEPVESAKIGFQQ